MIRKVIAKSDTWPLLNEFRISRGAKNEAQVVVVYIEEGGETGLGECVPYARYGESVASVLDQIAIHKHAIEAGENQATLLKKIPAGAARNAIDCAFWDLSSRLKNRPVSELINEPTSTQAITAQTVSLSSPTAMANEAKQFSSYPLLKLKLDKQHIIERVHAVHCVAPSAKLIIDANEAWNIRQLNQFSKTLKSLGVVLIEQPLPAGNDKPLSEYIGTIPLCADESFHVSENIPELSSLYQFINIKLDKTGGLTEAIQAIKVAKAYEMGVMLGCMVGTSLSMAPIFELSRHAKFIDLDGPALMKKDRENGFIFNQGTMSKSKPFLWGETQ